MDGWVRKVRKDRPTVACMSQRRSHSCARGWDRASACEGWLGMMRGTGWFVGLPRPAASFNGMGVRTTTGRPTHTNKTGMVHGTWYRANSGQANVQAPSHAVPHAARWRRPRHALRPQHAARSSARLPKHGAVGRRAMHGRKRRAAKQWAEGILPTRCPSRRPREAADYLNLPLVAGFRRCEAPDRPAAGCTGETGRRRWRAQARSSTEGARRRTA